VGSDPERHGGSGFGGARVAILEARREGELAELVRRRGGVPVSAPAVAEEGVDARAEVEGLLDSFAREDAPLVVFTTGAGVEALFAAARAAGRAPALHALLARATLACRGPKPVAALAREGLRAAALAAEPYTEPELLDALAPLRVEGRAAALLHHGERSPTLARALAARGARLTELTLYAWRLPADLGPLRALVEELERGSVDAALFTSQIQARHLFAIAEELGRAEAVRSALRMRTVVASIGPTCTRALEALGVPPAVVPDRPKMGALVGALAEYLARRAGASSPEAP
jgi:uroporphyrinogen-III synthase